MTSIDSHRCDSPSQARRRYLPGAGRAERSLPHRGSPPPAAPPPIPSFLFPSLPSSRTGPLHKAAGPAAGLVGAPPPLGGAGRAPAPRRGWGREGSTSRPLPVFPGSRGVAERPRERGDGGGLGIPSEQLPYPGLNHLVYFS